MFSLDTQRLQIREFSLEDTAFILHLLNEPSFIRNIADKGVRTLEQAADYLLQGPMKSYEVHGHGLFRVSLKGSPDAIGMCGLLKRDYLDDIDLGYAFLPEFWKQGYALESAQAVLEYGYGIRGSRKILAIVSPDNKPSIALLEKIGMTYASSLVLEGETEPVALYEGAPR